MCSVCSDILISAYTRFVLAVCAYDFPSDVMAHYLHDRLLVRLLSSLIYIINLLFFLILSFHLIYNRGMNFDNMPETADGSYPLPRLFPGYKLMWFAAACVYTIVIAFVLHTKVLHGAF